MMKVGIINYGLGNISAFKFAFKKLNCEVIIAEKPNDIHNCSHLILPAVGSFDYAISLIKKSKLLNALTEDVFINKKPIMGICVGMQILFDSSEEGELKGLGWIKGKVKKFDINTFKKINLPHMGWNNIDENKLNNKLCFNLNNEEFYFLHSYHCVPEDKDIIVSTTEYGQKFCSAINSKNIFGCQFHPEKSHDSGLKIFSNFLKISQC